MIERYLIKDLLSHRYWSEYKTFRDILFAIKFENVDQAKNEIVKNLTPGTYQIIPIYIKINLK